HPALTARVKRDCEDGRADVDLLSTHTKYAPSQVQWLTPIEDVLSPEDVADLLPRPAELARSDGRLFQYPRNLDMRLLYYRRDLFEEADARATFERSHRRPLAPPETWDDLVEVAVFLTRPGFFGFLFPGREAAVFGTFYELLVSAGGDLFGPGLPPVLDGPAGVWAADRLAELHHRRRVTPRELPSWHYDEVS